MTIGATPDGRKNGTPTADTTSPAQGMDTNGPLSTMKSVAKIPNIVCSGGNLFNMKFSPLVLQDQAGRMKFSQLLRTFLGDLKGMHVQFNIVDKTELEKAKADFMERTGGGVGSSKWVAPLLPKDYYRARHQLLFRF